MPHNNVSVDITGDDDDSEWVFVLQGDTNNAEMSILVDWMPATMQIDSGLVVILSFQMCSKHCITMVIHS